MRVWCNNIGFSLCCPSPNQNSTQLKTPFNNVSHQPEDMFHVMIKNPHLQKD